MPFEYESSSLGDLVSDTLAAFTARAQAQSVTLTGSAGAGVDPVMMAPDKISRVLQNLVDNALRYTPANGAITISAMREGDDVHVIVRDTGSGIPAEDLPHVFDRFYRGEKSRSRAGGGAGLGLAIARRVVQAHGGEIWVDSIPGQGTSMHFTLPKERKESGDEATIGSLFTSSGSSNGLPPSGEPAGTGG
jgi:signal transduction histidine kinase